MGFAIWVNSVAQDIKQQRQLKSTCMRVLITLKDGKRLRREGVTEVHWLYSQFTDSLAVESDIFSTGATWSYTDLLMVQVFDVDHGGDPMVHEEVVEADVDPQLWGASIAKQNTMDYNTALTMTTKITTQESFKATDGQLFETSIDAQQHQMDLDLEALVTQYPLLEEHDRGDFPVRTEAFVEWLTYNGPAVVKVLDNFPEVLAKIKQENAEVAAP